MSFRLLTELYSFLLVREDFVECIDCGKFPSPYGVIFILTKCNNQLMPMIIISFCLLTEYHSFLSFRSETQIKEVESSVSVSLRSYIHSYPKIWLYGISTGYIKVSVSLRIYIHSYWSLAWSETTEAIAFPSPYGVIFILMIAHSTFIWISL